MNCKHLKFAVVLLIGLVTQWSCRTNRDGLVQPANLISIDEARGWFEGKNAGARVGSTAPSNRLVFWKYAQNNQLPNGTPVVVVPLLYGYNEPLMIGKGDYTLQAGKPAKLNGTKADVRIQKKLMVSKDDAGNYRSCVMVVIPSKDYRKQSSRVSKDKFDGVVQIYDENEEHYLLGLHYKDGKLKRVLRANSSSGGRLDDVCYMGNYQQNPPNQVGGGGGGNPRQELADQYGMPVYVDLGDSYWFLMSVQQVDCDQNTPTNTPTYNPDAGMVDWIVRGSGGGGGGGGDGEGGNHPDPNDPIPVEEQMPGDLSPTDAFFWQMEHRTGTKIYFDENEKELIRGNFSIAEVIYVYVQNTNTKPLLTIEPDNEGLDLISLNGGLEPYAGPDPSICNECTESSPGPGVRPFFAPRSAFPAGALGDMLYQIDKALAQSSLFPGIGALRAPSVVFRAATFRSSLNALRARPSGVFDAHHMLPQKFSQYFTSRGINIHEPRFGTWWESAAHQSNAYMYNQQWADFISRNPNASIEEILHFAKQLMGQYGFDIFWLP